MKRLFTEPQYIEAGDKCLDFIKRMLDPSAWPVQPFYGDYYDDEFAGKLMWGGATGIPDDARRVDPVYIQPYQYYRPGYQGLIEGTYQLPAGEDPQEYAVAVYEVSSSSRSLLCFCPLLVKNEEDAEGNVISSQNYWCTGRYVEAWEFYQNSYDREKPLMKDGSGGYVPWSPDEETGFKPTKWYETEFFTSKVVYGYWAKQDVGGDEFSSIRAYEIELVRKDWNIEVTQEIIDKYLSSPAPRPGYTRPDYIGMGAMSSFNLQDLPNIPTVHERLEGFIGKDDIPGTPPTLPKYTRGTPSTLVSQSFIIPGDTKKHSGFIEYGYSYFVDYKINVYVLVLGDAEYLNGEAMLWSEEIYALPSSPPAIPEMPVEIIDYVVMLGADRRTKNYCFLASVNIADASLYIPGYATTAANNMGQLAEKAAYYTYKVSYNNPSTAFQYQLKAGTAATPLHTLPARPVDGAYQFLAFGDPQLTTDVSFKAWADTLHKATTTYPSANFIATLGDNVDAQVDMALAEKQFSAFLAPLQMHTHPLVTIMGNHDDNMGFDGHFFPPNETAHGKVGGMGDYYLKFESTLILVLNTNANKERVPEHLAFMDEVIPTFINIHGRPKWIIVMFHHSIFQGTGTSEQEIYVTMRNNFAPYFSKYRVDLVLMGHVHSYGRTYVMDCSNLSAGDKVTKECVILDSGGSEFTKVSHGQTLYITLNSASGSKFYPLTDDHWYIAKSWQKIIPNYTCVDVNNSRIKITTHETDTNEIIDDFTLYK